MTVQLHAAAVLARLRTSGSPVLTVHDGQVPGPPEVALPAVPPYVLVPVPRKPQLSSFCANARAISCASRSPMLTAASSTSSTDSSV